MGIGYVLQMGARTWAVDYRMPPDHPYPVPLDDCVAAYRSMLEEYRAEEIVVGGASAGGNLAAALILRARGNEGLPAAGRGGTADAGDRPDRVRPLLPDEPRPGQPPHREPAAGQSAVRSGP